MTEPTTRHYIDADLRDGCIDTWLVAGPEVREIADLERFSGADYKLQIVRDRYDPTPGVTLDPVELGGLSEGEPGLSWRYYRCRDDHYVDLSGFYHIASHLRAWAYAELIMPAARAAQLALTTNAPADIWVNGRHIGRAEHFHHQIPHTVTFPADLRAGPNAILVRFEAVATRECPYVMALQVVGETRRNVRLPTNNPHQALRVKLERIFASATLDRDVFARNEQITVRWPEDLPSEIRQTIAVRLQSPRGRIYVEALPEVKAGMTQPLGLGAQFLDGPYRVVLMPHPDAYYTHNIRLTREIPISILKNRYADTPYGTYAERRIEALEDAAQRPNQVYAEIAKMELGRWNDLNMAVIDETIDGINRRKDCSDFYLIGLLGAFIRYGNHPEFPQELRASIRACALGFRYWSDDPGADAMWFWSENHQILFHACETLAGQIFAGERFSNTGHDSTWHAERGTAFAIAWLRKRASGGFREWDSNCYFEHDVLALAHLADLANDKALSELSAVILDKLFFTMALNSFRGAFGSTHGRTYTPYIKGARLELTSGIGRLLWGLGVFNEHILGTVALACAPDYELPPVIAEIATAQVEHLWSRERHRQELTWEYDRVDGMIEVNKVTYRTADYMLCSAQDHLPGEPGVQQHIWQATLSHDATVFVTHPPCISEENSHRPSYWHGHVTLPRVAQWHDTLVDVRNIPEGDWLGFTHAYFPTFAFDEHLLRDGWAFARVGNGYLAITAAAGLELMTTGDSAYRELRSPGRQNIWLAQMGRAAHDGDFAAFQERVLAHTPAFDGLEVRWQTPRAHTIRFGWTGPLLVDEVEQPLRGFKHYESPVCVCELGADTMEIAGWDQAIRLDFRI